MTDMTLRARVALTEIEAMGLSLDDLLAVAGREVAPRATGPTVADYVLVVAASYQPRSRRTYNSYWRLAVELLGHVTLDRVTVDDLMNPALLVDKPRRLPNRRRALNPVELDDLWAAAAATTKDPGSSSDKARLGERRRLGRAGPAAGLSRRWPSCAMASSNRSTSAPQGDGRSQRVP